MRYFDQDEAARLNAEPWQLELLKANPPYLGWGPHEDYMADTGESWSGRVIKPTWAEFGPWELDELNECVNFYFEVNRASEACKTCGGNGYATWQDAAVAERVRRVAAEKAVAEAQAPAPAPEMHE